MTEPVTVDYDNTSDNNENINSNNIEKQNLTITGAAGFPKDITDQINYHMSSDSTLQSYVRRDNDPIVIQIPTKAQPTNIIVHVKPTETTDTIEFSSDSSANYFATGSDGNPLTVNPPSGWHFNDDSPAEYPVYDGGTHLYHVAMSNITLHWGHGQTDTLVNNLTGTSYDPRTATLPSDYYWITTPSLVDLTNSSNSTIDLSNDISNQMDGIILNYINQSGQPVGQQSDVIKSAGRYGKSINIFNPNHQQPDSIYGYPNPDSDDYTVDRSDINSDYTFNDNDQYVTMPLTGKMTCNPNNRN